MNTKKILFLLALFALLSGCLAPFLLFAKRPLNDARSIIHRENAHFFIANAQIFG